MSFEPCCRQCRVRSGCMVLAAVARGPDFPARNNFAHLDDDGSTLCKRRPSSKFGCMCIACALNLALNFIFPRASLFIFWKQTTNHSTPSSPPLKCFLASNKLTACIPSNNFLSRGETQRLFNRFLLLCSCPLLSCRHLTVTVDTGTSRHVIGPNQRCGIETCNARRPTSIRGCST